jgi:hypothetical protein
MDATCQAAGSECCVDRQCHGIGVGSGGGSSSGGGDAHAAAEDLGEHRCYYHRRPTVDMAAMVAGRWPLGDGCCSANQWQASYMQSKGAGSANPTQLRVGGNMINP